MKTNVVLTSQSRELFGITIRQETKTGFLNLTDLQASYNSARTQFGWIHRDVNHVMGFKDNVERLYFLLEKQCLINCSPEQFTELVEKQGIAKTLKEFGVYKTTGRGDNKTTSCNPYIWVLIAMEMNPILYATVIMWLGDKLLLNRIEAGDMYRGLSRAVQKFNDTDYVSLAKALNHVVFKKHESGLRNSATEQELKELHTLESNLAFAVDSGFIKSFPELMEHIRGIWKRKYTPLIEF